MITIQLVTTNDPRGVTINIENPLTGQVLSSFPGAIRQDQPTTEERPSEIIVKLTMQGDSDVDVVTADGERLYFGPMWSSWRSFLQVNADGYFRAIRDASAAGGIVIVSESCLVDFETAKSPITNEKEHFAEVAKLLREIHKGAFKQEWFREEHNMALEEAISSYDTIAREGVAIDWLQAVGPPAELNTKG